MTKRMNLAVLSAMVLLVAACGSPGGNPATSTTSTAGSVTTAGASATTVPDPTTSTTNPATTTSPAIPAEGEAGALFASLSSGDAITSARMEGSMEMTGLDPASSGISEAVILFSTAVSASGDSSFLMDMSSMTDQMTTQTEDPLAGLFAGMIGQMEAREIGDTVYLKYPFITSMLGAETEWVSMPAEESGNFTSGLETMPTDPDQMFESFDQAGATLENLGVESVNGVEATHYRVTLDTEQMDLTPEEKADLAASGIFANGVIPMEIWVSGDGYMVRMIMEIDGAGMDLPDSEGFETMTIRYDMFDINGDITIEPPPASDVTPMEDLESSFGVDG